MPNDISEKMERAEESSSALAMEKKIEHAEEFSSALPVGEQMERAAQSSSELAMGEKMESAEQSGKEFAPTIAGASFSSASNGDEEKEALNVAMPSLDIDDESPTQTDFLWQHGTRQELYGYLNWRCSHCKIHPL
jgi:hypothetical protein